MKIYVLIIKDVTSEREIETLKTDFVATLTHDLKVPIVAAANMIDLFLAKKFGEISDKQEYALSNMKMSNQELLNLVQILLETYKISDKGVELFKEKINLNQFIETAVDEMQPLANDIGVNIVFKSSEEIQVSADSLQLQRVIKNLLNNAIDHSHTKKDIEILFIDLSSS